MKVIDKIAGDHDGPVVFSFEFFTPKLSGDAEARARASDAFVAKVARLAAHSAAFYDITWRPRDVDSTLALAGRMQREVGVETMMHLTCLGMPLDHIDHALSAVCVAGVQNVLALRGDPPLGIADAALSADEAAPGGPACALDLVEHIRSKPGQDSRRERGRDNGGVRERFGVPQEEGGSRDGFDRDAALLRCRCFSQIRRGVPAGRDRLPDHAGNPSDRDVPEFSEDDGDVQDEGAGGGEGGGGGDEGGRGGAGGVRGGAGDRYVPKNLGERDKGAALLYDEPGGAGAGGAEEFGAADGGC